MKFSPFWVFSWLAGGLVLLFIGLPLANTLLSTPLENLAATLIDAEVGRSMLYTFGGAGLATLLAVVGGVPLAYLLARTEFPGKRVVEAVVDLPVVIPHTAAGVALLLVFGRQGMLGKLVQPLGIHFTDDLNGIVVAMMFVSIPYLVNASRESFRMVDAEMERVAMIDGASPWQAFWLVTLPQAWRGVLGGMLMMWARGISEFGAVVILAYHPKVVPVLVFERFQGYGLDSAQPVAVILIIVVLVVFSLLRTVLLRPEKP